MTLTPDLPRKPRPRDGVTNEYRRGVAEAMETMPADPHYEHNEVKAWMTRHGWRVADLTDSEIGLVGDVLAAVLTDLTLCLIEETPADYRDIRKAELQYRYSVLIDLDPIPATEVGK